MKTLAGNNSTDDKEDSSSNLGGGVFSDAPLFVDGELDEDARETYLTNACEGFRKSEWAPNPPDESCGWNVHTFLSLSISYLGVHVEDMTVADAAELLLELYPQKVTESADKLDNVIDELVAFWKFCDQVHHLGNAAAIAKEIESWRTDFHKAMTDSSNFGLAKGMFMSGTSAGFDMSSQEGANAFVTQFNLARLAALSQSRIDEPQAASQATPIPQDLKQRKKLLKKLKRK